MKWELHRGDCRPWLTTLPEGAADAVVTDPPYELGFMGKGWDRTGVAFDPATWRAVLRVVKPGGYLLAMGGSRTYHRLACAVEDAGFEVRDCVVNYYDADPRLRAFADSLAPDQRAAFEELAMPSPTRFWNYGTGWPKGKGCLKPSYEPILLCRRPGPKVLPLGVKECSVPAAAVESNARASKGNMGGYNVGDDGKPRGGWDGTAGRYPANTLHDGSDEVLAAFAAFGERKLGGSPASDHNRDESATNVYGWAESGGVYKSGGHFRDAGTAARFFYCAKADKRERAAAADGTSHPTVKPLALMRYLVKLVCPVGGLVLDPFAGSGTTLLAAVQEGRRAVGCELDPAYHAIATGRLMTRHEQASPDLFGAADPP